MSNFYPCFLSGIYIQILDIIESTVSKLANWLEINEKLIWAGHMRRYSVHVCAYKEKI